MSQLNHKENPKTSLKDVDAIILAGGLGTRLREVLPDQPKVLAIVGGYPVLDLIINWLVSFGVSRIILSLGYKANLVINHIEKQQKKNVDFIKVVEDKPLGTGGALKAASHSCKSNPILVVNGDTLVSANLCSFYDAHLKAGAEISLMYSRVDNTSCFGNLKISKDRVQSFVEKSENTIDEGMVSAGVYFFKPSIISNFSANKKFSLENEILSPLTPNTIFAWGNNVSFWDIGTPSGLAEANRTYSLQINNLNGRK